MAIGPGLGVGGHGYRDRARCRWARLWPGLGVGGHGYRARAGSRF